MKFSDRSWFHCISFWFFADEKRIRKFNIDSAPLLGFEVGRGNIGEPLQVVDTASWGQSGIRRMLPSRKVMAKQIHVLVDVPMIPTTIVVSPTLLFIRVVGSWFFKIEIVDFSNIADLKPELLIFVPSQIIGMTSQPAAWWADASKYKIRRFIYYVSYIHPPRHRQRVRQGGARSQERRWWKWVPSSWSSGLYGHRNIIRLWYQSTKHSTNTKHKTARKQSFSMRFQEIREMCNNFKLESVQEGTSNNIYYYLQSASASGIRHFTTRTTNITPSFLSTASRW